MSDTNGDTDGPDTESPPKKRRKLHRHFSIGVWMILSNIVLFVFIFYMTLSLTERALTVPRWLTQRIEAGINAALPEGRVSVGRMTLKVNDAGLPAAQAINVGLYDARGVEVARLNQVSLRLSAGAILNGEIKPRHLDVIGAQINVLRRADGSIDLSFGGSGGATGTFASILDSLDDAFAQDFLVQTQDIAASDLTIALQDARSGRIWQITDGALTVNRLQDGLDLAVKFDVFNGTEDLAETQISISTDAESPSATVGASFRNAAASDIALQSPALAFLGVVNAPISGSVRSQIDSEGGLGALNAALEIGKGALQPTPATRPIGFESAKAYLSYDPQAQKISFDQLAVRSDSLRLDVAGQAYLQDFDGVWPRTFLGQFQFNDVAVNSRGLWDEALKIDGGGADLRIRLDPFSVEFGQISAALGADRLSGAGRLTAEADGWSGGGDVLFDGLSTDRLIALWPRNLVERTRDWMIANVASGQLSNLRMAGRVEPARAARYDISFDFHDAAIRPVPGWPLLVGSEGYGTIRHDEMTFVLEKGSMISDLGPRVDFAGTVFRVADMTVRPTRAVADVRGAGPAAAIMSLLSMPPTEVLAGTRYAPDFVSGDATVEAEVSWMMSPDDPAPAIDYQAKAEVRNVRSEVLLPGQVVTSPRLEAQVNNAGISVSGPFDIGAVTGRGTWAAQFGPEAAGYSRLTGQIELSRDTVDQFDLGLPDGSVGGEGRGDITVQFAPDMPTVLTLASDLDGVRMGIPAIGWTKAAGETGELTLRAEFSDPLSVTGLNLTTSGLSLGRGELVFNANGGFEQAILPSVRVGQWLDAPVILDSRGSNRVPAIAVSGGRFDLTANPPGGGAGSDGGPISAKLNQVRVTSSITLTEVEGNLTTQGGLQGPFSARVNGGARIDGVLDSVRNGTRATIRSTNAGRVMASTGIFESADGGDLALTLVPLADGGDYRGELKITNTNVKRAPVLTELLSALSIVGLLDQMAGNGIAFTEVEASFVTFPDRVELRRMAAVGPSLGISLDGSYDLNASELDMQGVMSPIYFLNALGQVVSPREGEGLFGFTYTLTGPSSAPVVGVNPLSILVPGALRDIFRKQKAKEGASE